MRNGSQDEHMRPGFSASGPYPEIKVVGKNSYYADLLLNDYASVRSEFTATSQYIYHSFILKGRDEEVAEMLENVSIVEMMHMEILAELIILLGKEPLFRGGCNKPGFWSAENVYYGCGLCDQMEANLQAEIDAIKTYRYHICLIDDPYIKKILERIIEDEEVHVRLFEDVINNYRCMQ